MRPDMNQLIPSHDLLWIVLDSLRYDVAQQEMSAGRTPHLARLAGTWERRHTPGSFTLPAHAAFFAGFLPTPADPAADRQRLFAARFAGSESTGPGTKVFETADIVSGLRAEGFRSICVGGVGFFSGRTPLSSMLPGYFDESHWREEFGVTSKQAPAAQTAFAASLVSAADPAAKLMLFMNVAAIHQPNYFYLRDSGPDDLASHAAALRAVDAALPVLLRAWAQRGRPLFWIVCSDHGTAYGEDGFTGHRAGVDSIWTVPYAHGILKKSAWRETL